MINKKLNKVESNELLELYNSNSFKYFKLGYIKKIMKDHIIFQSITEYGTLLGYEVISKKEIIHIKNNTEYINRFKFYMEYNKDNSNFNNLEIDFNYNDMKNFDDILSYCFNNNLIVTINSSSYDDLVDGKIIAINKNNIILSQYDLNNFDISRRIIIRKNTIEDMKIITIENILLDKYIDFYDENI